MHVIADIESGNVDLADILFLIATVLFVIAGFLAWRPVADGRPLWAVLISIGLACVSLGFLVL
jgi:hypothetical protein